MSVSNSELTPWNCRLQRTFSVEWFSWPFYVGQHQAEKSSKAISNHLSPSSAETSLCVRHRSRPVHSAITRWDNALANACISASLASASTTKRSPEHAKCLLQCRPTSQKMWQDVNTCWYVSVNSRCGWLLTTLNGWLKNEVWWLHTDNCLIAFPCRLVVFFHNLFWSSFRSKCKCKCKCKEACIALSYMKLHLVALRHGPCLMGSHRVTCHPHVLYSQGQR